MRVPILLLALLAGPAGAAQPPSGAESGLLLGLRAGFGLPLGDLARDDAALGDVVASKLPIALEVGYRFGPRLGAVTYLEVAPASLEVSCPPDVSCSAYDVRFGLAVLFHLAPGARVNPWLGLGFGIEVLDATYPADPLGTPGAWELQWIGLEFPVLEGGLDLALSDLFTLGPYASATLAQFTSLSAKPPGGTTSSGSIDERATHGWVQFGLRATLRL